MDTVEVDVILKNTGKAFVVKRGQCVRVIARTVVDCVVFNLDNLRERFDQARTRCHNGKIFISTGDQLYSKLLNRPMMTIVEDMYTGRHDLQYGTCSKLGYDKIWEQVRGDHPVISKTWGKYLGLEKRGDLPDHGCWENMQDALEEYNIAPEDIPSPFGLFRNLNVVGRDGKIVNAWVELIEPEDRRFHIDLHAEMNCLVVLSACPADGLGTEAKIEIFGE